MPVSTLSARTTALYRLPILILLITLSGCFTIPRDDKPAVVTTLEDAATFSISALPPLAWSDIASNLAIKNNLTIDQCRQLAINTTQADTFQSLSVFSSALGLTLPSTAASSTTSVAASGQQQTTAQRTTTSGAVPALPSPQAALPAPTAATPDLSKQPLSLGADGNTVLWGGTALCQQAQILDNLISKASIVPGYRLHLVTLQINVQPKARNLSYDTDLSVTFLPHSYKDISWSDGGDAPAIVIYPLIAADSMEVSNVGRSEQALRQALLQLSGVINGVGANFGTNRGAEWLKTVIGYDKNSITTLGVAKENTLHIRIGAQNSGRVGLAMVPRSYNVSVAIMTKTRIDGLTALAQPTLLAASPQVVALGGARVLAQHRDRTELARRTCQILAPFDLTLARNPVVSLKPQAIADAKCSALAASSPGAAEMTDAYLGILRAIDHQDYKYLRDHMKSHGNDDLASLESNEEFIGLQKAISALATLQIEQAAADTWIPFKKAEPLSPVLIPQREQLGTFVDDKKSGAIVTLQCARPIPPSTVIHATISVKRQSDARKDQHGAAPSMNATAAHTPKITSNIATLSPPPEETQPAPSLVLLSSGASLSADGSQLQLKFPSLKNLQLVPDIGTPVCLTQFGQKWEWESGPSIDSDPMTLNAACYAIAQLEAPLPGPETPIAPSTSRIVVDGTNNSSIELSINKFELKDPPKDSTQALVLTATGANIIHYQYGAQISEASLPANGIPLVAKTTGLRLFLYGVSPSEPVTLTTKIATTDQKQNVTLENYGAPITLRVERVATQKL